MTLARADDGRLDLHRSEIDLEATARSAVTPLQALAAAKQVTVHGGRIWVLSEENVGSAFSIALPADSAAPPLKPTGAEPPAWAAQRPGR